MQTFNLQGVYLFYNALWIFPTVMRELEILKRTCLRLCINENYENFVKNSQIQLFMETEIKPFSLYTLSLLSKYIDRLGCHENRLMAGVFRVQTEFNWPESNYLSPIGIIHEDIEASISSNEYRLPQLYGHSYPGWNRG